MDAFWRRPIITDLIKRLEAAPEGSREFSDEVLKHLGWHHRVDKRLPDRAQWGWLAPGDPPVIVLSDPSPTENLQDAVDAVPEGWHWTLEGPDPLGVVKPYCLLGLRGSREEDGTANTPALALMIAILKARHD